MALEDLKRAEAILMKILYDYKVKLWESPLTQEEKAEIETRFLLLKNATEIKKDMNHLLEMKEIFRIIILDELKEELRK